MVTTTSGVFAYKKGPTWEELYPNIKIGTAADVRGIGPDDAVVIDGVLFLGTNALKLYNEAVAKAQTDGD